MEKDNVYSSWFREKLHQNKVNKAMQEKIAEENAANLPAGESDDAKWLAEHSDLGGGLRRDTGEVADSSYLDSLNRQFANRDNLSKAELRELQKAEKEYQKALDKQSKIEGASKKIEETVIDEDTNLRIQMERQMLKVQREREYQDRRALSEFTKNKNEEAAELLKIQAEKDAIKNKELEEEFKRQERLKRENEANEARILKKRRKAAGSTWFRRLQDKMRIWMRIYSFQNLQDTVNTYGYTYSFGEFARQTLAIVGGVTFISWYSKVRGGYLFFIIAATILSTPLLLYSWFNQMFNSKRFEMVQSYLSNILPVFMQKPKIRYALSEVKDMSQGQMETAIQHALDYIDTTTDDENIMTTALTFIENEFPNSRIKAVHKLLLDVESGNSKDYTAIVENMYVDVEAWIRRVYGFQKDLKSRRTSLIVLCAFSLVLNSVFTVMYSSNEIFNGFTDRPLYQISTTAFIILIMATIAGIITQLHGTWLIYDSHEKENEANAEAYNYIHMNTPEIKKKDIFPAVFLAIFGVFMMTVMGQTIAVVTLPLAAMFLLRGRMKWNGKMRRVTKTLMLEFPVWLRGVALNLHEMTVVNAIKESQKTCSYCMSKEIDKFFEIYNENPTSIRAFNEFLSEYKIEDVQATMKVLFTVQSMSQDEIQNQVSMLITRNQELLTKTETIQNQDSLGYAEMLGYMPMILLTAQLLISMVLMFLHIMDYMDVIMTEGMEN